MLTFVNITELSSQGRDRDCHGRRWKLRHPLHVHLDVAKSRIRASCHRHTDLHSALGAYNRQWQWPPFELTHGLIHSFDFDFDRTQHCTTPSFGSVPFAPVCVPYSYHPARCISKQPPLPWFVPSARETLSASLYRPHHARARAHSHSLEPLVCNTRPLRKDFMTLSISERMTKSVGLHPGSTYVHSRSLCLIRGYFSLTNCSKGRQARPILLLISHI